MTNPPTKDEVARIADDDDDDLYDDFDDTCWECGGEGFVSSCFSEYACLYPEDGCDLCTRRCDVCRPREQVSAFIRNGEGDA